MLKKDYSNLKPRYEIIWKYEATEDVDASLERIYEILLDEEKNNEPEATNHERRR